MLARQSNEGFCALLSCWHHWISLNKSVSHLHSIGKLDCARLSLTRLVTFKERKEQGQEWNLVVPCKREALEEAKSSIITASTGQIRGKPLKSGPWLSVYWFPRDRRSIWSAVSKTTVRSDSGAVVNRHSNIIVHL